MAKIQIKSERITPFGGIFHVREQFSRYVGPVIDKVLGLRCTSFGYQYGEIAGSLASVYFYPLSIILSPLSIINYSLSIINYPLSIILYLLASLAKNTLS